MYTIIFKIKARKELLSLPDNAIKAIAKKIDNLSVTPRPSGCKKLEGSLNETASEWGITECYIPLMMI